jgi:chromate reductase, NAD(P)H dehydrogenase (quinone)
MEPYRRPHPLLVKLGAMDVNLLLISGSLRAGSTNAAALRTALGLTGEGVHALFYDGMADLPHFNPDDDAEGAEPHPAVAELRREIGRADALLICTPEYAGALPGALKNLLEWTIGDAGTYDKPVAWINVAGPAAPGGGADAHDSLRKVLGYSGADIVEAACVRVPLERAAVGENGLVADPEARAGIGRALNELASHVRARKASSDA